jgi:hypothetical protein
MKDQGYEWQEGHCAREDGAPMVPPDDCGDKAAWALGWKALDYRLTKSSRTMPSPCRDDDPGLEKVL